MTQFAAPISEEIWKKKYRLVRANGKVVDETVQDTWWRIAWALSEAEPEAHRENWAKQFYQALEGFKFLPAGRIVAGAGTGRRVTLSNCFTMGTIPDSMDGIFEMLKEAALTMQQGGGIGYDFSTIRPKGSLVKGVDADASGPLSFMDCWDSMCRTIMSAGSRRGAMMATMRCDHPDIEDFIEAKQDSARLRMFNLSVLVTDEFMRAVEADADWRLVHEKAPAKPGTAKRRKGSGAYVHRVVKARDLWDKIMRSTYDYAEPGVIFIDRVNDDHNIRYLETIATTNPSMPAGTMVHTRDGIFPIETLENQSFEVKSLDGSWAPARCFLSSEDAEVVEIDFGGGKTVRCTPEHRWPVETNGRYLKSDTSDLRSGDRVPLCLNEPLGLKNGELSYVDGVACGLILGDGSYGERSDDGRAYLSVSVNKEDTDIRDFLCSYLDCNFSERESEFQVQLCRDKDVRAVIDRLGLSQFGTKTHLPKTAWESNDDFITGLIAGLFGSDGHVHTQNRCLVLTSKTKELIREVGVLLSFHGVNCTFRESQNGEFFRTDLVITFGSLKRFNKIFTIWCDRKRAALASFVNNDARDHVSSTHQVVQSVKPVGRARVWDIAVDHDQHVFPSEWAYTGNCGEKPMGPYASCLLGSINLAALVENPFTAQAGIDEKLLTSLVATAIRMMDNVVDVGGFPLEAQRQKAKDDRQLGLGVTGLADALAMCQIRYGSEEAAKRAERWMQIIDHAAYMASTKLAEEKGSFPTFDAEKLLQDGTHASRLPDSIKGRIIAHGLRNALLTSVAPTGTISLYAGNVSSGIEPIFATAYTRGSRTEQRVVDYAVALYEQLHRDGSGSAAITDYPESANVDVALPDYFVTAQTLKPEEHVRMQAAVQKWVDSSISKTINLPEDISFEDFKEVYALAYRSGCKGCTTYRPNDVTGSVLSVEEEKKPTPVPDMATKRPEALPGRTYKLNWPQSDHAIYVTISDIEENGLRRPFEIFINSKNMEHYAWTVALTRMISAVFRRPHDSTFVVEELKAVFDPRGGAWQGGRYVPSILAAIGSVIETHMHEIGYLDPQGSLDLPKPEQPVEAVPVPNALCPKCNSANFVKEAGCSVCKDCGHSACG